MTKFTTIPPVENTEGFETFDLQDIEIIAKHYGYDFAECRVKNCGFNNNLIGMVGYCLVKNGEIVKDNGAWRKDISLLKKFYEFDIDKGFIEPISFEEYVKRHQSVLKE